VKVIREHVTHPDQSFRFLRFETTRFEGAPHRHHHLELTWIEAGAGLRFVGDSVAPFQTGDLVLLGANTPHCWLSSRSRSGGAATVVQFSPSLLARDSLPELARFAPLAEKSGVGLLVGGSVRTRTVEILADMRTAGSIGRLAGLLQILELLQAHERSLTPLARRSMQAHGARTADGRADRRIDRVLGWIHRQMARELTVAEAARMARVTPGAFSRYFRHEVGKPFTEYVNDVRCSEACVLLRRTDKSVAVIAQECGFATLSHFNRQFRLRYDMTPREFRDRG
jgi:AraC-like DNA-binding protein/mannose-6-phosphate isomerase-like protein (cupin superfamily)